MILFLIILCCCAPALCSALLCRALGSSISSLSGPLSLVAIGILLCMSCTHLLPEAIEHGLSPDAAGATVLGGIILLNVIEMFFNVHGHGHNHGKEQKEQAIGAFGLLGGDFLHTLCDGVVIASAFSSSAALGVAVTLAILSHEIAHELGDYAILLQCGFSRKKACAVFATALTGTVCGGIMGFALLSHTAWLVPYALALSGASFLYVSLADLLPRQRKSDSWPLTLKRLGLIFGGIAISGLITFLSIGH